MPEDLQYPPPAKWTKKDYLDTAKSLGVLGFDLGLVALGAYIGNTIDHDLAVEFGHEACEGWIFTFLGAITAGALAAGRYD
jgi:hypothetical protein